MKYFVSVVGLWGALALANLLAHPQTPRESDFTLQLPQVVFRGGIDAHLLTISVLDSKRMPVRGLTAADFVVREENRVRPIVALSEVDLSRAGAPVGTATRAVAGILVDPAIPPTPADEGRLIVILFDRTILATSQRLAREAAKAAVDGLGPNDLAAVVFDSSGARPQGFTSDPRLLDAAIEQPMAAWPEKDPYGNPERGNPGECLCGLCAMQAVERVATALEGDRTRRKLLLFIGRETGIEDWWYEPPEAPWRGGLLSRRVDCRVQISLEREKLTKALRSANLTVYTFNPDGLETGILLAASSSARGERIQLQLAADDARAARTFRRDSRQALATLGAGRNFETNSALDVRAMFDETSSYYLLGFEPLPPAPGKDHHLEVRVNRRGLTVQAQRWLRAPEAGASPVNP